MVSTITMQRFGPAYRVIVFGASGGIGGAFAEGLASDPACAQLVQLARTPGASGDIVFDLHDEGTIEAAAETLSGQAPFHLMIDATGMLSTAKVTPEKSLAAVSAGSLMESLAVNAIGPILLLKHFAPHLSRDAPCTFVTLSARVGSIADNRLGGWYGYRASKAALNMFVRTAAIEIARKNPQAVIAAMHPGTVATDLSAPFAGKRDVFTPAEAVNKMLALIDSLTPAQSGGFFAYDGTQIPW